MGEACAKVRPVARRVSMMFRIIASYPVGAGAEPTDFALAARTSCGFILRRLTQNVCQRSSSSITELRFVREIVGGFGRGVPPIDRLSILSYKDVFDHQCVQPGSTENAERVFERVRDWLAHDVQTGVEQNGNPGAFKKRAYKAMKGRVPLLAHGLHPAGAVGVDHSWHFRD